MSPILDRERVLSDSVNLTFNLNQPPPGTSVRLCEGGVKPPHSKAGRARKRPNSRARLQPGFSRAETRRERRPALAADRG